MTPPDGCACPKSPGMYGMGGWHFVMVDQGYISQQIREAEALARANPGDGYTRGGIFQRWTDEAEFWRANGERYLGTAVAWEPCPAYRAKVRQAIQERQS